MVVGDESGAASLLHSSQSSLLQQQSSLLQQQQSPLLQHPLRLGGAEAQYLEGLMREKESLGSSQGMDLARRLVSQEIERVQVTSGIGVRGATASTRVGAYGTSEDRRMADVTKDKAIKLTVRVIVPVREHPRFNFVGKLLGPKGNSLKRLQEETMTKMAILGRGSMRDKKKEEELRTSGDPKFGHLAEDLHVEVTAVAPPAEAHARLAYALTEIRRYLVPDYNDEIRQRQMREMQMLNSSGSGGALLTGNSGGNTKENKMGSSPEIDDTHNNGNMITESEEGSLSPDVSGSSPSSGSKMASRALAMVPHHPALRGLNGTAGKDSFLSSSKAPISTRTPGSGGGTPLAPLLHGNTGRRSVLSLLTRARAIQQKEQELMEVYQEIPGYGVYDHLGELPFADPSVDDMQGRGGGALKVTNTAVGDRARFRHDPYTRVPASS